MSIRQITKKILGYLKKHLGVFGLLTVCLLYWLNDDLAKHFFPKLNENRDEWDKAYFMTQFGYAYMIGVIAAVFAKGKFDPREVYLMSVLTGLAGGDIMDRLWKVIYDPKLDLTKVTEADFILLILSIYYAHKKYVSNRSQSV